MQGAGDFVGNVTKIWRTTEHVPMTDAHGRRVLVVRVRAFRREVLESGQSAETETSQMYSLANGAQIDEISAAEFKVLRTGEILKLVVTQLAPGTDTRDKLHS